MFQQKNATDAADLNTERNQISEPMIFPIAGSTFDSDVQLFSVSGLNGLLYGLTFSTNPEGPTFDSGVFNSSTSLMPESEPYTAENIPEDGEPVYVRFRVSDAVSATTDTYLTYITNIAVVGSDENRIQSLLDLVDGFGENTTGGAAGTMTRITSVTDGSLLSALTDNVARWIYFDDSLDGQTWNAPLVLTGATGSGDIVIGANKTIDGRDAEVCFQLGTPDTAVPGQTVPYKTCRMIFRNGNCISYGIKYKGDLVGNIVEADGEIPQGSDIEVHNGGNYVFKSNTFTRFSDEALSVFPLNGGIPDLITMSLNRFIDNKNDALIGRQDDPASPRITQSLNWSSGAVQGRSPGVYYGCRVHIYNCIAEDYNRQGIQVWNNCEVISQCNILDPGNRPNPNTLRFAGFGGGAFTGVAGKLNDSGSWVYPSVNGGGFFGSTDSNFSHPLSDMFTIPYAFSKIADEAELRAYLAANVGSENVDRTIDYTLPSDGGNEPPMMGSEPAVTLPADGATLTTGSQTVTIENPNDDLVGFWVGSAVNQNDYFNSGQLQNTTSIVIPAGSIPSNGQDVFLRLAFDDGSGVAFVYYEYTAATVQLTLMGLGPFPRLVPQSQGYALNDGPVMPLDNIVIADSHQEFLNELDSNKVVVPNFSGYGEASQEIQAGLNRLWIPGFMSPGQGMGFHVGSGDHNLMNIGGANESVFQGFRLAPGTDGADGNVDPFRTEGFTGAVKTVFDGMHILWGRDQLCSIWYESNNVLVKSSILGPTADNVSGRGPIVGSGSSEITFLQCLLPGGRERNPSIQGSHGSVINCMVIGWEGESLSFSNTTGRSRGNIVGNIFDNYNGNSSGRGDILLFNGETTTAGFEVYIAGNVGNRQSNPDGDQMLLIGTAIKRRAYYASLADYTPPNTVFASSWVGGDPGVIVIPVSELADLIYPSVGPGPNRRDSKIQEIITRCQNGTMAPDSSGPVSGLPSLASGASRIDTSRADLTTQEFRELHQMPDSANGLVDTPEGSPWPWFFHFNHYNRLSA